MDQNQRFLDLYKNRDSRFWNELEVLLEQYELPLSELLINYPAFIRRRDLPRLLADYELFKLVKNIPGSIAEFGVYLGSGAFTWGKLLETFQPGDRSRLVIGFEGGQGYTNFSNEDGAPDEWIESKVGRKKIDTKFLEKLTKLQNSDNLIAGVDRVKMIYGDIEKTSKEFVENNQGTRFSLLYFDVNLYRPTLTALEQMYPLLSRGGVIAFNGYGAPPWEGESKAIEDYFASQNLPLPKFNKFEFSIHPSAFAVKE